MRQLCSLLLLIFVLTACGSNRYQQETDTLLQATFDAPERLIYGLPSQESMDYLLYLPDGFYDDAEKDYPLIVYLHGAGSTTNDASFLTTHGLPRTLHNGNQPDNFDFVMIAPQAFPNQTWWGGDALQFMLGIVNQTIATYNIDKSRVYITGVSMGGYGTWWTATEFPDRFAAGVSVSGSGYQTPQVPPQRIMCRMRPVSMWMVHGAGDLISDPDGMQIYYDTYTDKCGDIKFTMYEDTGHLTTPDRIYEDPALYEWLLTHSLSFR